MRLHTGFLEKREFQNNFNDETETEENGFFKAGLSVRRAEDLPLATAEKISW